MHEPGLEPDAFLSRSFTENAIESENSPVQADWRFADLHRIPVVPWAPWRSTDASQRSALAVLDADRQNITWEQARHSLSRPEILAPEELCKLFPQEFIENANALCEQCTAIPREIPEESLTPRYLGQNQDIPELKRRCEEALCKFLAEGKEKAPPEAYRQRLDLELDVISRSIFTGIFLTVADLVDWATKEKILRGPGRGSASGSLICYLLGITRLDPLKENLFFERFINPDRITPPDFDLDIPKSMQKKVQRRLVEQWGVERSLPISGRSAYKLDAGFKAAARARGVPANIANQETTRQKEDPGSYPPNDRRILDSWKDAKILSENSCTRALTVHPGGIALFPVPWRGIFPTYPPGARNREELPYPALQYDHEEAETLGAVKTDILSLIFLDSLADMRTLAGDSRQDPWELPSDPQTSPESREVFQMLSLGKTRGIFQLAQEGMTEACREVRPNNLESLQALISLFRPGPIRQLPSFARRNRGEEAPEPAHPLLREHLRETHGILVYQEQAIQTVMVLAGFTAARADVLRKAIGKKKREDLPGLRQDFLEGCRANHIDSSAAREIWSQLEAHAGYSFNKSHAAAYARIAYATAWYRKFHPKAFFAATAQAEMGKDKGSANLRSLARDMASEGFRIEPPEPGTLDFRFLCAKNPDNPSIFAPPESIPGVGPNDSHAIVSGSEPGSRLRETLRHSGWYRNGTPGTATDPQRDLDSVLDSLCRIPDTPWNSLNFELENKNSLENIQRVGRRRGYLSLQEHLRTRNLDAEPRDVPCMVLERGYFHGSVTLLLGDGEATESVSCSRELGKRIFSHPELFLQILPGIPLLATLHRKVEGDRSRTQCSALRLLPDPETLPSVLEIRVRNPENEEILQKLSKLLRRHQPGKSRVVLVLERENREIELQLPARHRTPDSLHQAIQDLGLESRNA